VVRSSRAPIADLVRRFYGDVWGRWDDQALEQLLSKDFVFRGSLGDEEHGRDGFRAYRDRVRAAFPDFCNEIVELVAEGDRAAVRLRCSGTHLGTLFAIQPTGRAVTYEAAAFLRSRDGRLSEAWVLGDLDGLRAQLS
jgi:predicted ester cyclase